MALSLASGSETQMPTADRSFRSPPEPDEPYNLSARIYSPASDHSTAVADTNASDAIADGLAARVYADEIPVAESLGETQSTVPVESLSESPKPRLFFGWWIVIAGALINMYAAGVWFYGFPIFYKALLDEFGWSAAAGAAIISLSRLEGGLEGPIIGWLVDRYGPRRLAIIGAVMVGFGFMAMSKVGAFTIGPLHVSALVAFGLLYAGWMSIGFNTGFFHASGAAVNAWFIRKRSRAFSLYSLGAGGAGITVFALGWIVNDFGWRTAAFLAGVGIFLIVLPLSLLLRSKPEDYGYLPDGDDPQASTTGPSLAPVVQQATTAGAERQHGRAPARNVEWAQYDFGVAEAIKTFSFWMIVLSSGARSVAMTSIIIHQVVYLTEVRGIPLVQASAALGGMVTISLVGRLSFGFLGDRIDKRYLLIVTYLLQTVGIFLLMGVSSIFQLWVFVVLYGIAYGGAIPLNMAIVGEYFGRLRYATIRGFMQMFLIPATVLGPLYAGWVYDSTGNYEIAFSSFIIAMLVGTVFIFFARRPPVPQSLSKASP